MTGVSIADFSRDVLAPWFSDGDDSWRSNRKTFNSAMDVAAHALWWGLTLKQDAPRSVSVSM